MSDILTSRFFTFDDPKMKQVVVDLPEAWWSRPYEYAWASSLVSKDQTILDAACGISQPLKFYICNLCEKVHACDIDERITSKKAMAEEILKDFGPVDAGILLEYAGKPHLSLQDITKTTYDPGMFDLIICISALEYLPNKQILAALSEFKRILKDGGLIAITLDYPVLEIKTLNRMLQGSGLTYASEVNFELPCNALNTDIYACGLYSFRALLKKAENS